MGWRNIILCGILTLTTQIDAATRFANLYGDGMVLQMAPAKAHIWGYADSSGSVTVLLDGQQVAQGTVDGSRKWSASLPATDEGGPHTIEVQVGGSSAKISDVHFGDVWYCAGQSNMVVEMYRVMNATDDLRRAATMPQIRFMKLNLKTSSNVVEEPQIEVRWQKPGNDDGTRYFSGLCMLYAMEMSPHFNNRPFGLIQAAWGGTPIEAWSSPSALAKCPATNFFYSGGSEQSKSQIWNAMSAPITALTIKGVIWYQGESNSDHATEYKCAFKALIEDWRDQFHTNSGTDANFPFGFVQLGPWRQQKLQQGFIDIRWSQTYEYGYVPNPSLQGVFMTVAFDLPDFNSPIHSQPSLVGIHPRDKETLASRLALAGRAVAYGEDVDFQGPIPTSFQTNGNSLVIEFDDGNGNLDVRTNKGFEICCGSSCYSYRETTITSHDQSSITLDASSCSGQQVGGVRYVWEESPCAVKMCAIYSKNNDLPAPCFKKSGPF